MARSELERWKAEHPHANAHPAAFEPIRAGMTTVKLSAILEACGVTTGVGVAGVAVRDARAALATVGKAVHRGW
jgi:hypothetical protein